MKYVISLFLVALLGVGCTSDTPSDIRTAGETFVTTDDTKSGEAGDWQSSGADDGMDMPPADAIRIDGDWQSSGGDGVLCFETKEIKDKSQPFLRDKEYLDQHTQSFHVLEYQESFLGAQTHYTVWSEVKEMSDEKMIVAKVLDRLRKYSPVFAQKMDLALESIRLEDWVPHSESLSDIQDSNPNFELTDSCQLIQLAERRSVFVEDHLPQVEVNFDQFYYERLSTVEKAMLVFHEALYLIGKQVNHESSDAIRELNARLFSNKFEGTLSAEYFSQSADKVQTMLGYYFGDYIRFFVAEDFYTEEGEYRNIKHKNNYTRSKSFIELNKEMRAHLELCHKEKGKTNKECADALMLGDDLKEIINTDEKAFLFLLNYFFDSYGMLVGSSEYLYVLDHNAPLKHDDDVQLFLGSVCGMLEAFTEKKTGPLSREEGVLILGEDESASVVEEFQDHMWLKDSMLPSLKYCKDIRLLLRAE